MNKNFESFKEVEKPIRSILPSVYLNKNNYFMFNSKFIKSVIESGYYGIPRIIHSYKRGKIIFSFENVLSEEEKIIGYHSVPRAVCSVKFLNHYICIKKRIVINKLYILKKFDENSWYFQLESDK